MKILVTGGGGFIGSHVASHLSRHHQVSVVDIEYPKLREKWWSQAHNIYTMSIQDYIGIETVFSNTRPDLVMHFASDMGGVGYFTTHDYYPYLNNMKMDMNILSLCERYNSRLFYSSSACIYPTHLQQNPQLPPKLSEGMIFPANSDQMYGWEKLMMTMLCQRSPVDTRVGIFHTIYGEGQEFEGERAKFPPTLVKKVLESKQTGELRLWGNGKQKRTFLYIDDAVEKIARIALSKNYEGEINVAGDECISVIDTAKMVCEIVGVNPQIIFDEDKPSGVLARDADNTKFKRVYNYKNKFTLKEGFSRLVKWVESVL